MKNSKKKMYNNNINHNNTIKVKEKLHSCIEDEKRWGRDFVLYIDS